MTATMEQALNALQSPMKAAPKDGLWRYGVRVLGIRKRGRKEDWHVETGPNSHGLTDSKEYDPQLAANIAREWISQNMRNHRAAFAMAWFVEYDEATGMETWEPMNEAHNKRFAL